MTKVKNKVNVRPTVAFSTLATGDGFIFNGKSYAVADPAYHPSSGIDLDEWRVITMSGTSMVEAVVLKVDEDDDVDVGT